MSLEEKLQALVALRTDLSHSPETLASSAWHEDILRERQQRIDSGEAIFIDWEQAKAHIRIRAS